MVGYVVIEFDVDVVECNSGITLIVDVVIDETPRRHRRHLIVRRVPSLKLLLRLYF